MGYGYYISSGDTYVVIMYVCKYVDKCRDIIMTACTFREIVTHCSINKETIIWIYFCLIVCVL